jgi:hypothetical protein
MIIGESTAEELVIVRETVASRWSLASSFDSLLLTGHRYSGEKRTTND